MNAVSAIIQNLGWVAWMVFVVRAFLPFFDECIRSIHPQRNAILLYITDCFVGNIAIFREKIAFVDKERVLIDLCDMSQFLVVGRVDLHMCMNVVLAPIGHKYVPRFPCKFFVAYTYIRPNTIFSFGDDQIGLYA